MLSKAKAFWLGLLGTLAVLVPLYLAVAAVVFTRTRPTDTPQTGVPVAQPLPGDAKNLLLMTGPEGPDTFVLLRFDAYTGSIGCVALPAGTIVLMNGAPRTLAQASSAAGPAQAAVSLAQTLEITVDNYLYCTAQRLAEIAEGLGSARVPLSNYMTEAALGQLQLDVPGVQTLTLTPQMMADVLASGAASRDVEPLLRAEGYLAFLRAGADALAASVPDAVRAVLSQSSTNLTATQMLDYERVLTFLGKITPEYRAGVLPGEWTQDGRYELAPGSVRTAAEYFARGQTADAAGSEAGAPMPQGAQGDSAQGPVSEPAEMGGSGVSEPDAMRGGALSEPRRPEDAATGPGAGKEAPSGSASAAQDGAGSADASGSSGSASAAASRSPWADAYPGG